MNELILSLVTIIVTFLCGIAAKKSNWISNNLIPIQNIGIGLIFAIVEWIVTGDFSLAITLSGLTAGGAYDIGHNIVKLLGRDNEY